MTRTVSWVVAMALLLLSGVLGCGPKRFAKIPGETDLKVSSVVIQGEGGKKLPLETSQLRLRLGLRPAQSVYTDRYFNPFRLAEDRRRVRSFFQTYGFLDAEVLEPEVKTDEAARTVAVTWTVKEGKRYELADVRVENAPAGQADALRARVPFSASDPIDLEAQRKVRYALAEYLQRQGWGHARVYSRTYVDRPGRKLHHFYFVDAGPRTRIGSIRVEGAVHVPADEVLARTGLHPGDPYSLDSKEKAEFDLLDTGAYASAVVDGAVDTEIYFSDLPDSGGVLGEGQVDDDGKLVGRKLSEDVDVVVRVVEAPSRKLRLRAGVEGDAHRVDSVGGGDVRLRNFFGAQHHLSFDGRIGYGWVWRKGGDNDELSGVFGDAGIRYDHPGFLARLLDLRLTARYRDVLYPGFHLRELTAGPGVRTSITRTVFFDLDVLFRLGWQVGFGPFDEATRRDFALPATDDSRGAEADASIVWDARNDPLEPTRGHLLALRVSGAPGGALGDHRWALVAPEARGFLPLSEAWSLGVRASGGWLPVHGDEGVPLGPRLFGGGAFGMRGFFRNRLSPVAASCIAPDDCRSVEVGGLSLFEGSVEARWLRPQEPLGLVVFTDIGGASRTLNPFEAGPSFASGLGLRIRTWFAPVGVDVAYRWLRDGRAERFGFDPLQVFVRIGEGF